MDDVIDNSLPTSSQGHSPVKVIGDSLALSPTLPEQSVLSVSEEDTNSLNEGFIDEDGDMSTMSANISYIDNSDLPPRCCLSDSAVNEISRHEYADEGHQRSLSYNPTNNQLQRRGTLRRGRPNSLKAGLLQGEQDNVMKLRRSFGLDKSEIGDPIPLCLPDTSGYVNLIQLRGISDSQSDQDKEDNSMEVSDPNLQRKLEQDCPSNLLSTDESTVYSNILVLPGDNVSSDAISKNINTSLPDESPTKTSKLISRESMDSLLSVQTDSSPSSPKKDKKHFPRSISTDSGKGSLLEESGMLDGTDVSSKQKTEVENKTMLKQGEKMSNAGQITGVPAPRSDSTSHKEVKPDKEFRRFVSTVNVKKMTTSVSRSQSVHESSVFKKTTNHTPNLQISSETHKLLSRAGYVGTKQIKSSTEDIQVMGPPSIIKHADAVIPKHESIMELQTNLNGKVKNCVKSLETDVVDRHVSPYRFPNSVSRKRGCSPIRIPTVFAKNEKEAAKMKDIVTVRQKLGKGQARLPISTNLLKPTETATSSQPAFGQSSQLSRKPSIYYAKDKDGPRLNFTITNKTVVCEELMDTSDVTAVQNKENTEEDCALEDQKQDDDDVCTPVAVKPIGLTADDMDATPTNAILSKVPSIKLPILPGNLGDRVLLRTSGGQTPRHVIRNTSKSPRSPIKPVKRLGSPGSPCRNTPRRHTSPKNRTRLSSIPHHLQEDMSSV